MVHFCLSFAAPQTSEVSETSEVFAEALTDCSAGSAFLRHRALPLPGGGAEAAEAGLPLEVALVVRGVGVAGLWRSPDSRPGRWCPNWSPFEPRNACRRLDPFRSARSLPPG